MTTGIFMSQKALFSLLVVDNEDRVRKSLKRYLARQAYRIIFVEDVEQAFQCLSDNHIDLMLLDLKTSGNAGLEALKKSREIQPGLNVIMLSACGRIGEAVAAIQAGALDFLEKSASLFMLNEKISQIYRTWLLERENISLREELENRFSFDELIGESPCILHLKDFIARVSPTETSVLIQGESGTGKELVARAIHQHSGRRNDVFIPVDCAAITASVMESELFGHAKGAFTGAAQSTVGLIRSANSGTLFLDEVGELPIGMQAKLLRTIQERTVRPVGSTSLVPVDIRIVAATNRNLLEEINRGTIRQDFYYRLSAVTLNVPPLRDRLDDIPLLVEHFIKMSVEEGMPPKSISNGALAVLRAREWFGNVRELENAVRSAMAFTRGDTITPGDLAMIATFTRESRSGPLGIGSSLADYEFQAIRNALDKTGGNRRKASLILGISEATLYRRLKHYRL